MTENEGAFAPGATCLSGRLRKANLSCLLPGAVLVTIGIAAYANSFSGQLVFDDWNAIVENPSIRSVPLAWRVLGATPRPVAYATFALNYALHRTEVWGYHAVNLAIHLGAALVLFGLVRRTLSQGPLGDRYQAAAPALALAVALLWMVHPLQTQSVTYLVQRMESLAGLFYLLTLYGLVRAEDSPRPGRWQTVAVLCCALGMATKEVVATAPVMVLWYDRVFLASSWRELVRRRALFYAALAATWLIPGTMLLTHSSTYAHAAVAATNDVPAWQYALSQPGVILHYLRLAFWPQGQCLDYGWPAVRAASQSVPALLAVGALIALTLVCVFWRPAWGFVGGWFFVILAPTSSIVPLRDLAFEHRMYLPLAAVAVTTVLVGHALVESVARRVAVPAAWRTGIRAVALAAAVAALACATHGRNRVYHDQVTLWRDTAQKAPHHLRAQVNLAWALSRAGNEALALEQYRRIKQMRPNKAWVYCRLAGLLRSQGRLNAAETEYRQALRVDPQSATAYCGLGLIAESRGRSQHAAAYYRKAIELRPAMADAHFFLACLLLSTDPELALRHFQVVATLQPWDAETHYNAGVAHAKLGNTRQAIACYREALRWDADRAEAHLNLGKLLAPAQPEDAAQHYRKALQIRPQYAEAHNNLGALLTKQGRYEEAAGHLREALRIKPDYANAHVNLARALALLGRFPEAVEHLQAALRLKPEYEQPLAQDPNFAALWKALKRSTLLR